MIKCQRCSGIHEHASDCRKPSVVLRSVRYKDWEFFVPADESYLQVRFSALQLRSDGRWVEPTTWHGRKWRLSAHMTRSEIVQTAFMAVLVCEEHECRESFKYRGEAVFGPHFNVDSLVKLCEQGQIEVRSAVR